MELKSGLLLAVGKVGGNQVTRSMTLEG